MRGGGSDDGKGVLPRLGQFGPQFAAVLAGTGLTYLVNNRVGLGPVLASSSIGLAGSLVLPSLAASLFCGTLTGMVSSHVIGSALQLCMLAVLAALGLCLLDANGKAVGVGGRLGLVAQLACSITVLLTGPASPSAAFLDTRVYNWATLGPAAPRTLLCSLGGAVLTKILRTVPQFAPRFTRLSSPVAAASAVGVIAACALPTPLQGPVYAGAFVAMSGPNVLPTRIAVLGAVMLAAGTQVALSGVLTGGWSGKLGTAAFIGAYTWARVTELLAAARQDKTTKTK